MSTSSHSYPMTSGDDQHSYVHNSSYQKAGINGTEEKTRLCIIEKLDLELKSNLSYFGIADFGCSVGPNTFHVVQSIIDAVKFKHLKEEKEDQNSLVPLEFLVFFNDRPNNDFNTLYRTQRPSSECKYFSVGVPGSFYGRVLPRNIIHIGYTSYATHWLSKVPEQVCDEKSPAWNKYYIHCNNMIEEVTKAYKVQFIKDMDVFFEARAEELVPGGLMILSGPCVPDGVPMYETWQGHVLDTVGDCLNDMAKSGITSEEKMKLFSSPVYFPQFSELKEEIEKNKSFKIEMMETISHPMEEMSLTSDFIISSARAFLTTMIEMHFGDGVVDELFDRLARKLSNDPIDFEVWKTHVVYYVVIKRK